MHQLTVKRPSELIRAGGNECTEIPGGPPAGDDGAGGGGGARVGLAGTGGLAATSARHDVVMNRTAYSQGQENFGNMGLNVDRQ
jgi:hypothetical protein